MQPLNNAINGFARFATPIAQATVMPAVDLGSNILGHIAQDVAVPKTQQLPQGVQSPIPQSQVVPHQPATSWLGLGINNGLSALANAMGNFNRTGGQAPQRPFATPTPTTQPTVQPTGIPPTAQPTVQPTQQPTTAVQTAQQQVLGTQDKQMPTTVPGLPQQVSSNFLSMLQQILPVTRQYGIPDALVAGQAAQESGYMQHPAGQYNFFGLKGHSSPWANFNTPQEGATYYAQTIKALVPNIGQMSPEQALVALQAGKQRYEGSNPDPMTYVRDIRQNPAWQAFGGQ